MWRAYPTECGLDFAREAVKAKAHLDVRQKADHGDSLDASEPAHDACGVGHRGCWDCSSKRKQAQEAES